MFWQLPAATIHGILNGMSEQDSEARPCLQPGSPQMDAFFEQKAESKLAFQAAKGLQVGGHIVPGGGGPSFGMCQG